MTLHATQASFDLGDADGGFCTDNAISKHEYIEAIHLWIENKDADDTLSAKEIGAMSAISRLDAFRKFAALGVVRYSRENPRADIGSALITLTAALADNERGIAGISQRSLASLLGRSLSTVQATMQRLRLGHYVATLRGRNGGYMPMIPRIIAAEYNHIVWLIEALQPDAVAIDAPEGKVVPLNVPDRPVHFKCTDTAGTFRKCTDVPGTFEGVNVPESDAKCTGLSEHNSKNLTILNLNGAGCGSAKRTTGAKAACIAGALAAGVAATALPVAAHDAIMAPMAPPNAIEAQQQPKAVTGVKGDVDLNSLAMRLEEAAGEALASPASYPRLLFLAEPQQWLASGCDLERHILPVIRAMSRALVERGKLRTIKSWQYFSAAIAEAKAIAEAVLEVPAVEMRSQGGSGVAVYGADGSRRSTYRDFEAERREQFERGERAFERVFGKC